MSHPREILDFDQAQRAVSRLALVTPLLEAPDLSERAGVRVLLKPECLQITGSFKVRGAAARLSALTPTERRRGVVVCSSGNHGRAVSWVARRLSIPATVYVPEWVDPVKLAGIREQGAEAVLAGATFDEAEARALAHARDAERIYVSAYDDPWVIAGQGTLALEILDALEAPPSAVLVPLSGGGLVAGIAAALHHRLGDDAPPAIAVSAERASVMLHSVRAGKPVQLPEQDTLASALAGGIGPDNRWSFRLVRDLIHRHVVVTEDEIAEAMAYAFNELRLIVEGGAAVALAAVLTGRWRDEGAPPGGQDPLVVVLSGGNVSMETLARVVSAAAPPPRPTASSY